MLTHLPDTRTPQIEHGQDSSSSIYIIGRFSLSSWPVWAEKHFISALIPTDVISTVTRVNGRDLMLLVNDFCSRAHQLWAKCTNGLHLCPLLNIFCIHSVYSRDFTQQIQYLKHYYKHNPSEICRCCQELFLACFLQMNTFPWVFPLHLGWLLSQSAAGYVWRRMIQKPRDQKKMLLKLISILCLLCSISYQRE